MWGSRDGSAGRRDAWSTKTREMSKVTLTVSARNFYCIYPTQADSMTPIIVSSRIAAKVGGQYRRTNLQSVSVCATRLQNAPLVRLTGFHTADY
jgi:hypothetical protein